jgi:type I restriction enzyme M protein
VDRVDKDRLKDDPRFPFGLPRNDNANYLWIQLFYSSLNDTGRAGFVMANSASDARGSELDIRKQIIEAHAVDVMVAVGSNFFYTVTLPCTLWFFDRGKRKTKRADQVLFIDARHIYRQIDRAHRDWTPAQIEFLANIARLYRGEAVENLHDSADLLVHYGFLGNSVSAGKSDRKPACPPLAGVARSDGGGKAEYADVAGLCKVATIAEIEAQGWSLNPGRYVGVTAREEDDFDFKERLEEQNEELETLNAEARELEERIAENVVKLLEGD